MALIQHGNLAGEWLIGGVEAKGFAFVLVFLGLEALVLGRWNRTWLLLGAASAFHVLVGGWATVAAAMTWLFMKIERRPDAAPPLRSMWPGLLGGLVLALPGLIPPLWLDWGTKTATVRAANEIYVYERLPHHLNPWRFPLEQLAPFYVLCLLFLIVGYLAQRDGPARRLRGFVVASLAMVVMGTALNLLGFWDRATAGGLLRFYWFRLADVAVPIGLMLLGAAWITSLGQVRPALGRCLLAAAIVLAGFHVADCAVMRLFSAPPYTDRFWGLSAWASAGRWVAHPGRTPLAPRQPRADRLSDYAAWREVCAWAAEHLPADATVLTPRMSQTFKWYAQRGEAGTWKELPQDAGGIVEWYGRMGQFYGTGNPLPWLRWHNALEELGAQRLADLAAKEHFQYVLTTVSAPLLADPLESVHRNATYVIYRVRPVAAHGDCPDFRGEVRETGTVPFGRPANEAPHQERTP